MATSSTNSVPNNAGLPDPNDAHQVLKFFLVIMGSAVLMKVAYQAIFVVWVLAFPFVYFYAASTCPSNESFDAPKELKRVLRGYHLPENDPNKPKGLISETLARVQASAGTAIAMAPGYEISMYNLAGAATLVILRIPTIGRDCYWLGAFGKWHYLGGRDITDETKRD